jgi:hypothetical protein
VGFEAVELKMLTADESVGVYKVLCPISLQQCHTPFTVEAHEGGHRSKPHEVTSVQSLALVDNTGVSGAARTMSFEASTCAVLCCAVLCCALLCCAVLCCAMLCHAVLCLAWQVCVFVVWDCQCLATENCPVIVLADAI